MGTTIAVVQALCPLCGRPCCPSAAAGGSSRRTSTHPARAGVRPGLHPVRRLRRPRQPADQPHAELTAAPSPGAPRARTTALFTLTGEAAPSANSLTVAPSSHTSGLGSMASRHRIQSAGGRAHAEIDDPRVRRGPPRGRTDRASPYRVAMTPRSRRPREEAGQEEGGEEKVARKAKKVAKKKKVARRRGRSRRRKGRAEGEEGTRKAKKVARRRRSPGSRRSGSSSRLESRRRTTRGRLVCPSSFSRALTPGPGEDGGLEALASVREWSSTSGRVEGASPVMKASGSTARVRDQAYALRMLSGCGGRST